MSLPCTVANVHNIFICLFTPDIPANEGCFRPVEVVAPERSIFNCKPPAPTGGASVITLQFSLAVSLDVAEQEVQAAINAAGNFLARTEKLTPNAFHAVVGIVLYGTFNCTQALAQRWISTGRPGTVLNIVTTYASTGAGSGYVVPSACAKAGVLAMTRSLAVVLAPKRIRVNAVAFGSVMSATTSAVAPATSIAVTKLSWT